MKFIEGLKLKIRANKYRNKDDKGGIAFITSSVQPGQTVMDIGAHKAGYLYFFIKQVGTNGKVFAFEPQKSLFQYISGMKDLFYWKSVTVEHLALSDSTGTVTLYIPTNKVSKGSSPGASIVEGKKNSEVVLTEQVAMDTLDAYCVRNNIKPDFLKIDVEGNELKVFQGGLEILKKYKPKILVEIEARHVGQQQVQETFEYLKKLGYEGYFISGLERVPLDRFSFEKHQNVGDKDNYCNNFIFQ